MTLLTNRCTVLCTSFISLILYKSSTNMSSTIYTKYTFSTFCTTFVSWTVTCINVINIQLTWMYITYTICNKFYTLNTFTLSKSSTSDTYTSSIHTESIIAFPLYMLTAYKSTVIYIHNAKPFTFGRPFIPVFPYSTIPRPSLSKYKLFTNIFTSSLYTLSSDMSSTYNVLYGISITSSVLLTL